MAEASEASHPNSKARPVRSSSNVEPNKVLTRSKERGYESLQSTVLGEHCTVSSEPVSK